MQRNQALMIGEVVGNLFAKQRRPLTPLHEFYPGLFKPEESVREMDLEDYTLLWEDFAYRHNERMKKKRGGGECEPGHHTEETSSCADGQHNATPNGDEPSPTGNENGNG